jgi:hypothetical protein
LVFSYIVLFFNHRLYKDITWKTFIKPFTLPAGLLDITGYTLMLSSTIIIISNIIKGDFNVNLLGFFISYLIAISIFGIKHLIIKNIFK